MLNSMKRNGLVLALFGMAATAVVAVTHQLTAERIHEQQQKELLKTLHQILPAEEYDLPLHQSCHLITSPQYLGSEQPQRAFVALKEGRPVGLALETTAPDGYNGDINLIIGINWNEEILGVRTLSHKETPGLGDGIDLRKSDWALSFAGYRLKDEKDKRISVKKDGGEFDQFTGATITPRAYTKAVRNALNYVRRFKEEIPSAPTCGEKQ